MGRAERLEAHLSEFIADIDSYRYTWELLRCLDVEIWQTRPIALPLAHVHGLK